MKRSVRDVRVAIRALQAIRSLPMTMIKDVTIPQQLPPQASSRVIK